MLGLGNTLSQAASTETPSLVTNTKSILFGGTDEGILAGPSNSVIGTGTDVTYAC